MSQIPEYKIAELKDRYRAIYSIHNNGIDYVFRALSFKEFDSASNLEASSADQEEKVIDFCLLWPENVDLDTIPAGFVTSLADEILSVSGFTDISYSKQLLEQKRAEAMEDIRSTMKTFIVTAMPAIHPNEVDDMTFEEAVENVALAEQILKMHQNVNGMEDQGIQLSIIDPAEEAAKAQRFDQTRKPGTATHDDPVAAQLHDALGGI